MMGIPIRINLILEGLLERFVRSSFASKTYLCCFLGSITFFLIAFWAPAGKGPWEGGLAILTSSVILI